jgi:hypothetical protein
VSNNNRLQGRGGAKRFRVYSIKKKGAKKTCLIIIVHIQGRGAKRFFFFFFFSTGHRVLDMAYRAWGSGCLGCLGYRGRCSSRHFFFHTTFFDIFFFCIICIICGTKRERGGKEGRKEGRKIKSYDTHTHIHTMAATHHR